MSSFASIAEARIQEAIESGELVMPASSGKELSLDSYFATPASLRSAFAVLKSASLVPPEVDAMIGINQLREQLSIASCPEQRQLIQDELRLRETELAMAMERIRRTIRTDMSL